jgi:uncharacterized membrane protein
MQPDPSQWRRLAVAALTALILYSLLWEMVLAPLRPGGSWLVLKALPLIALWPAVARQNLRGVQWTLLLLPWYFAEGVVRGFSETGRHAVCAYGGAMLAMCAIGAGLGYVRSLKRA